MIAIAVFFRENELDEVDSLLETANFFWTVICSGILLMIISLLGCIGVNCIRRAICCDLRSLHKTCF